MNNAITQFRKNIWRYYSQHQRPFPWRETRDPYHILVSELMLQQTQTDRVVPKYEAFLARFPDVATLAKAPQSDVLALWQGLGYNRRALYLHQSAQQIINHHGTIPKSSKTLQTLPGIGPYTAAAVLAFAFNQPTVVIETNIRTVFIHHFFGDAEKKEVHDKDILPLIAQTVDQENPREWYYALMDYGVYLKKLHPNPSRKSRHYTKQSRFEGSDRQVRGQVLRLLLEDKTSAVDAIRQKTNVEQDRFERIIETLTRDGFIVRDRDTIRLA